MKKAINHFRNHLINCERSSCTIDGYMKDLNRFNRYMQKKYNCPIYPEDVNVDDIEDYLLELKMSGQHNAASRSRYLCTLRSFFDFAGRKGYCQGNVAKEVPAPQIPQKGRDVLSPEEIEELVWAVEHPLGRVVIRTLYYTGLRVSEATNLKLDDVDLEARRIHVRQGKGNKYRIIPINDTLKNILTEYLEKNHPQSSVFFFATSRTGKISEGYINELIKQAKITLGWSKEVTAHTLRHSFATELLKRNTKLPELQKLLGHSDIKTTARYLQLSTKDLETAVGKL